VQYKGKEKHAAFKGGYRRERIPIRRGRGGARGFRSESRTFNQKLKHTGFEGRGKLAKTRELKNKSLERNAGVEKLTESRAS